MRVNEKFHVGESGIAGNGCIASLDIDEGEIICRFRGAKVSFREFAEKHGADCVDLMQIGPDVYLDLDEPYKHFNHSCDPNAGLRNEGVLFAMRRICAGEEITFDYSTTSDDAMWQMECQCGSPECRRVIRDFESLSHDRVTFYLRKGALLRFLLETYFA